MDDIGLQMTRRSPFGSGVDLTEVFGELDGVSSVPMSATEDLGVTPEVVAFVQGGILNGDFLTPPPDTAANLDDIENKLPGWSFTDGTSGIVTCKWVTGNKIRFTKAANGSAATRAYVEAIAPVRPSQTSTNYGVVPSTFVTAAGGGFAARMTTQFLDAAGATTGAADDMVLATGYNEGIPGTLGIAPTDAAFLRIRLSVRLATSATDTVDFTFASLAPFVGRAPGRTIAFSTIAGVNDYDATGCEVISMEPSGADRALTGVLATGWKMGEKVVVHNSSDTYDIVLNHNSGASSGLNRIYCPSSTNLAVKPLAWVYLMRGQTAAGVERWFVGHPA